MTIHAFTLGNCRGEVLTDGDAFLGLGRMWIGETLVRSGRLPIRPYTASFGGAELAGLTLLGIDAGDEVRVRLRADFRPMETKMLRDLSFDPIHEKGDWDTPVSAGSALLTVVLRPATYAVGGYAFTGFSYSYEYDGPEVPLFYLLDKASWELDGDITGATAYSQSSCSDPVATFASDTFWTTEGELFFLDATMNRTMTHNLPRWASHQAFDFQCKGDATLLGLFDHVELIRTLLVREPRKAELKCFDKHIFDETGTFATSPKAILLNTDPKRAVDQQNLWTWVFDDVHTRARAEFGLREQPPLPMMGHHYWTNRCIDTYYADVLPACAALGLAIFTENFKKSDAAGPLGQEAMRLPNGNMCTSHEYVISDACGGMKKFKKYIADSQRLGVKNFMWTNTYVSFATPLNAEHRVEGEGSWFIAMEDTRLKYGGAYTSVSSNLNFKNPAVRAYYIDTHRTIAKESGLEGFYIDSFYNLFFMPVDYGTGHPRTVWREALSVMKALQDDGVGFYIESFGPFGQPGHGHPASYNPEKIFIAYYVGLGNGYVTVPVPGVVTTNNFSHDPAFIFWQLAHKVPYSPSLFIDGERVDRVYGDTHRRVYADYTRLLPLMRTRYLQEDGQSVLWHDDAGTTATVWNFVAREVPLPGTVTDLTTGAALPAATTYALEPMHVYGVMQCPLPTVVGSVVPT
jgi:hypothetical protein